MRCSHDSCLRLICSVVVVRCKKSEHTDESMKNESCLVMCLEVIFVCSWCNIKNNILDS